MTDTVALTATVKTNPNPGGLINATADKTISAQALTDGPKEVPHIKASPLRWLNNGHDQKE